MRPGAHSCPPRRRYTDCSVIGYQCQNPASKRTWLNPEDSDVLSPGDKLVALARSQLVDVLKPQPNSATMTRASAWAIHRVAQVGTGLSLLWQWSRAHSVAPGPSPVWHR